MVLLQTSEKNTETSVIRKADLGKAGTNMELIEIGRRAKEASFLLGKMGSQEKNEGLLAAADAILAGQEEILKANEIDILHAKEKGMAEGLVDRLRLTPQRISSMVEGMRQVAGL